MLKREVSIDILLTLFLFLVVTASMIYNITHSKYIARCPVCGAISDSRRWDSSRLATVWKGSKIDR